MTSLALREHEAAATAVAAVAVESAAVAAEPGPRDISVRRLAKNFGERRILDRIGFDVLRGQAVALIGANGAGKSTLLRCCLRLIEPDEGSITLLGEKAETLNRRALRRLRARVGFVFQRHNLVPRLSALTNVVHGAQARASGPAYWFHSVAPRRVREEALHCLAQVGLADFAAQRVDTLSGGQSQRVAIARALMQRPALVLADEPVASLDPSAGEEVMQLFVDLLKREKLTFLYTSHNLRHATHYADRVLGLREGRLVIDAPAAQADSVALRAIYDR